MVGTTTIKYKSVFINIFAETEEFKNDFVSVKGMLDKNTPKDIF